MYFSMACFGRTNPWSPTNGTYQPPVGALNVSRTVVGSTASTGYGYTLGKTIAFGYLPVELAGEAAFEIEAFGKKYQNISTHHSILLSASRLRGVQEPRLQVGSGGISQHVTCRDLPEGFL